MRERGGGMSVLVVAVVLAVGLGVREVTATPTGAAPPQPAGSTMGANHVEDQYLDDALGDWLDNFGTYTFMVKQDLDTHAGDADEGGEGGQEADVGDAIEELEGLENMREEEEEEEGELEEEWSAPIAVSTGSKNLLNPHRDYLVTVESLVAEEGSIFLTLSKYENQTKCGVGGLTQEEDVNHEPHRTTGGGFDVARGSRSGSNDHTTFIAFGLQQEGNATSPDTSKWTAVSEQYWWARGQLEGGGMLAISFTPPECGCLALSTYFALPVGNLTLVVGPQAYPDELQNLLCIDPLAAPPDHEYDADEEEEEEEEEVVDYLQQPSPLVASRNPGEDETETEAGESPVEQTTVAPRTRKMPREEKKMAKKTRRQMKRQRIRQAGRRQARRQGSSGGRRTGRRWNRKKNQRKRTKVWKKLHKRGRKGRRRYPGGGKHHHHHHDGLNGTAAENMTYHHHHHHHHHHRANVSTANQEERLVDILLRDLPVGNSTTENETDEVSNVEEGEQGEAAMANEEVEGDGEEAQTPRQRRKNRRQHKKMLRKQRRKAYPPGVKFCCKQGVKHKKNILEFDSTSGNSPGSCNMSIDVVSTFANHQFGIEENTCTTTFTTCCDRFTEEMWEGMKAKKEARKTERKQRRKSRRQDRKQRRRQERRLRKETKRQSHAHHDEYEEPAECTGEEGGCVHEH